MLVLHEQVHAMLIDRVHRLFPGMTEADNSCATARAYLVFVMPRARYDSSTPSHSQRVGALLQLLQLRLTLLVVVFWCWRHKKMFGVATVVVVLVCDESGFSLTVLGALKKRGIFLAAMAFEVVLADFHSYRGLGGGL